MGSFIFADSIILPILNINRKDHGLRMSRHLLVTCSAAMIAAGLIVEGLFDALGLIQDERSARVTVGCTHVRSWRLRSTAYAPLKSATSGVIHGDLSAKGHWRSRRALMPQPGVPRDAFSVAAPRRT